jgi:hypothetical protein
MRYFSLLVAIAVMLGICTPVFGDGVAFRGRDFSSMYPVTEGQQRAVISHRGGIEKMLIAVSLELESEDKALWIFPVPGDPNKVKPDIVDLFPQFSGRDPRTKAESIISTMASLAAATQIYTLPLVLMPTMGMEAYISEGVSIHEQIERWGIHAEIVTAESVDDLADYLKNKGVGIDKAKLAAFEDYLSKKYTLVMVWISSHKELLEKFPDYGQKRNPNQGRWPCVYIEFPTEKPFYPLRPTRSYGDERIPIFLTGIGYVKPDTSNNFAENFLIRHYKQESLPENTPRPFAEDLPAKDIEYTSIRFFGPAKELVEDFWFNSVVPRGMRYAGNVVSIGGNSVLFSILTVCFILFVSYISAGLAGLLLFREWGGYAELGLRNVFTIIGLVFAIRRLKGPMGERLRNPEEKVGKKWFIFIFSILYLMITIILAGILLSPL